MSDNNNDLGAFLAGFVIGGLVGAATALILAPQSGEEMRSQLANKSNELAHAGGERVQQVRDRAGAYTQQYRERAEEVLGETRERVQETSGRVQEQARIVLDSGKAQAEKVRSQVSNLTDQAADSTPADHDA